MRRWGWFAFAGALGSAVQLVVAGLCAAHLGAAAATALGVEAAILHNFVWHRKRAWSDRAVGLWPSLLRFHLTNGAVSLIGNTAFVSFATQSWRWPILWSNIAAIGLCGAANFVLADRWVYAEAPCRCSTVSKAATALDRSNAQDFS